MELKLGKMTLEELANWFGCSYSTIRKGNAKKTRLEKLKTYAEYHFEGKSIYIDKIYIPCYSTAYDVVKDKFPETWHENGIDTCARVGSEIYWKNEIVKSTIQESTAQQYANRVKIELYGHNHLNDEGTRGTSEYCWCRKVGSDCEPLTDEQYAIIRECSKEVYGAIVGEKAALLNDALKNNEITLEEFQMGLTLTEEERNDCYFAFVDMVSKRLKFFPDKATRIQDGAWVNEMP